MFLHVCAQSRLEGVEPDNGTDHPYYTSPLTVADSVEDFLDLFCMPDRHLDRVGRAERIESKGGRKMARRELIPHFHVWMDLVGRLSEHATGKK